MILYGSGARSPLRPAKHRPRTLDYRSPGALVAAFWTAGLCSCEDRYAGDGAASCSITAGLGRKAILLINGESRAEPTRCSKCDHLLHDGSVRLDFLTDDMNEAEEVRIQTFASDCVAEIKNSNESGWVQCEADVGKRVRWKDRVRTMQRSLADA